MFAVCAPNLWGGFVQCYADDVALTPYVLASFNGSEVPEAETFKSKHRGSHDGNAGDGNYYSFSSKAHLEVSAQNFEYYLRGCYPVYKKTYTDESIKFIPARPGTTASAQGYAYTGGFAIRASKYTQFQYIIVCQYYNPNWYRNKWNLWVYAFPTAIRGTLGGGQVTVSSADPGWVPTGWCCEYTDAPSMEMTRLYLQEMDPRDVYSLAVDSRTRQPATPIAAVGYSPMKVETYLSPSRLSSMVSSGVVPPEYTRAVSDAYFRAMEEIPYSQINPLTVMSDAKALAKTKVALIANRLDSLKAVAQAGSSDYLQYRYGIKTTQMDIQSIQGTLDRFRALYNTPLRVEGYSTAKDGVSVKVECSWSLASTRDLLHYSRVGSRLMQRGLVDLWDIVPFSFVVDWFVDVEKYLTDISSLLVNLTWEPDEVWVTFHNGTRTWHEFARIRGNASMASTLIGLQDYKTSPGGRTVGYHVADSCALITQMFG